MLLQVLVLCVCASTHVLGYYVKPDSDPTSVCPGQPCWTLQWYDENASRYFMSGASFIFLPGIHNLYSDLVLRNFEHITLRGLGQSSTVIRTFHFSLRFQGSNNLSILWLTFDLTSKTQYNDVSALVIMHSDVKIFGCKFLGSGNASQRARAVQTTRSHVNVSKCIFQGNTGNEGGALLVRSSSLVLSESVLINNTASELGGAISCADGFMLLASNNFSYNMASRRGGAIYCSSCTIHTKGINTFKMNYVQLSGGAMYLSSTNITTSGYTLFSSNSAVVGGAIELRHSTALLGGQGLLFVNNWAETRGGGLSTSESVVKSSAMTLQFIRNSAGKYGGALSLSNPYRNRIAVSNITGATFMQNEADCGGAFFAFFSSSTFTNTNFTRNFGRGICCSSSNITFKGGTYIFENRGRIGAAIGSKDCTINFTGHSELGNNHADQGGVLASIRGEIIFFAGETWLGNNTAEKGGAIYAIGASILLNNDAVVTFDANSATRGGAMHLEDTVLKLDWNTRLHTLNNSATQYGGAIYHIDNPTTAQCTLERITTIKFHPTPQCFFRFSENQLHAQHDSAGIDGSFLYGGLLDRCISNAISTISNAISLVKEAVASPESGTNIVSSEVYGVFFCDISTKVYTVNRTTDTKVFGGQSFSVPLMALAQGNIATPTSITATTRFSRLGVYQSIQSLQKGCFNLTYNLYSIEAYDQLTLYPDGPCKDRGQARIVVNVTFLPCPEGFQKSKEGCICEDRLHNHSVECIIDNGTKFKKEEGSHFWMGVDWQNGSYGGLILSESCPVGYCKTWAFSFTLEDLDAQCDLNRSGVLCGQCANNHSLMLGSSRCKICSNDYLTLLLAFAAAGIALVAFLIFLKLTVATGVINSLILYANIIQANKKLLLPIADANVLTVFIAWLNLNFGIETCFYQGMTPYTQIWLQFVFPVYVWVLIGAIIVITRHSIVFFRLMGSDPIAVLATLLLMSYTKILHVIIEVYSYVNLDYPNEVKKSVWLKDGNIPYFSLKHLVLVICTTLLLVFLFLPYTLLLLLGYKLYRFTSWKHFGWFNKVKPLLESYYAPYRPRTRFWTGLLLLIRCALYVVFSVGGTRTSLLAIILVFTALIAILGLGRVFKSTTLTAVETTVYFNLVVLSTVTVTNYNWPALVYLLVGMVFAIMVCVILYQFYVLYISKTAMWTKLVKKFSLCSQHSEEDIPLAEPSPSPHKVVSRSVITLREPLLEM